jgi:hypothetical protein
VGGHSGFEPANLPFAIHSMAASATGALGLLSKEAGVFLWRDGEHRSIPLPPSVPAEDAIAIMSTGGSLWLRTIKGTYRLEDDRWISEQLVRNFSRVAMTSDGRRYGTADLPLSARGLWSWAEGEIPKHETDSAVDLIRALAAGADN